MKTITKHATIPENSGISSGFDRVDYLDSYRLVKSTSDSAEEIAAEIFKTPKWVGWLMNIRDAIVGIFGLKASKEMPEGQKIGFPVIEQSENEIVMGINDKHLDFRTSVFVDRENSFIFLTTLVRFNSLFGRLYFIPVKPFHKLIVRTMLKRQVLE